MLTIESIFSLKAIKYSLKQRYDEQNFTLMILSHEIYETVADGTFYKFHMK